MRQRADRFNKIGKPKFSFHALRHAAASLFIRQGWPAKKVQTILGHSSITMTFDVYGHLFDNAGDDVDLFVKLEADLEAAQSAISSRCNSNAWLTGAGFSCESCVIARRINSLGDRMTLLVVSSVVRPMEEIRRRRRNGEQTRSFSDIIDKAFVEYAETLRRLGE
nr:tyrosine-type recombinase/integrase [Stappia indica]